MESRTTRYTERGSAASVSFPFDGTANAPIAYPDSPEGTVRSTARLWLVFGSLANRSSHSFEWPISGAANAPFVLQTSTES